MKYNEASYKQSHNSYDRDEDSHVSTLVSPVILTMASRCAGVCRAARCVRGAGVADASEVEHHARGREDRGRDQHAIVCLVRRQRAGDSTGTTSNELGG